MVKTVAQSSEDTFLVQVDEGIGRVVELDTGIVFPPFNIDSIIARGYWDEVTDKAGAERAVELVKQQSE